MQRIQPPLRARRPGLALATAMAGIVVIGVLIGGVFFVSTQELRIGGGTILQERAFRAAELGLNASFANWNNAAMAALPTGSVVTTVYDSSAKGWVDTVRITRLNASTFSMVSSATVGVGGGPLARKSTGITVRLGVATFNFLGALTVRGGTQIGGSSYITGFDSNPSTWSACPMPTDTMPGIAISSASALTTSGCTGWSCVDGAPKISENPAASDTTTYFRFGDYTWATLTALATKVYEVSPTLNGIGPVESGGACDVSVAENWGSPVRTTPAGPCESYSPIIHSRGALNTLKITGGRGQGILLVDGDLEISGGFEFYGPVIVRGRLRTTGTGGKLNGGVMAANVDLEQNTVLGDATIKYSSCAVEEATKNSAYPMRVTQRAWVDLF